MQNDAFSALIRRLNDTKWAAFGGDKTTGCEKLSKALQDLAAWPAARNLAKAKADLGMEPDGLENARKKTVAAAAFLRAVHRKCGLEPPYPDEWAALERELYRERTDAAKRA